MSKVLRVGQCIWYQLVAKYIPCTSMQMRVTKLGFVGCQGSVEFLFVHGIYMYQTYCTQQLPVCKPLTVYKLDSYPS